MVRKLVLFMLIEYTQKDKSTEHKCYYIGILNITMILVLKLLSSLKANTAPPTSY